MQGDDFEVNAPTDTSPGAGNDSNSSSGVLLQREIKVLVVGNGNVGKSSMIKRLCKWVLPAYSVLFRDCLPNLGSKCKNSSHDSRSEESSRTNIRRL